jgi:4-amino-4-deoxy-L-arabinose transferase-like glycosyltransferase
VTQGFADAAPGGPGRPSPEGATSQYGAPARKRLLFMRPLLLVLVTSVALLSFHFGSRSFTTNDEARFPLLARDILTQGHWILPHLNGVPHVDKPPLLAWLIALASWPGAAVTQATAAVPSLLAALGVVLSAFWIAWRLFGADAATIAGLTSVTMYGVLTLARTPLPDMTLCAELTAATAAYVAAEFDDQRRWLVAFYALVGMAIWTKGPVGFLPLVVVLLDTIVTHGWAGLSRLVSTPGLLLLMGLLVPWWTLAVTVEGGERFWIDVARNDWLLWYVPTHGWSWRIATEAVSQTFTILLPWSPLLPVVCWWAAHISEPGIRRCLRLLLLWLGTMFVLVAVSHQQRLRYYLPLCPVTALLIAAWWVSLTWRRRTIAFASLWVVSATGLSLWIAYTGSRANTVTGLPAIVRELQGSEAPVYAVDAPELVFTFYLERPVRLLASPRDVSRAEDGRGGYLIIADRVMPALPATLPLRLVATGVVNQRPVSVFAIGGSSTAGSE